VRLCCPVLIFFVQLPQSGGEIGHAAIYRRVILPPDPPQVLPRRCVHL